MVYQLIVQDVGARVGGANESTDVLPIDGEGDIGTRVGRGERVWEYVEYVHCRSVEAHCNRSKGIDRHAGVPGFVVDLAEVQYRWVDVTGRLLTVFIRRINAPPCVIR